MFKLNLNCNLLKQYTWFKYKDLDCDFLQNCVLIYFSETLFLDRPSGTMFSQSGATVLRIAAVWDFPIGWDLQPQTRRF